ncbi:TonB-dependent siderophore receptor [Geobacter sp. SVR]|uniref:TonB-dependent receptor plug domain-containing protein n=1 Tax=Geobacter sp. SVR TaxID=2495594 RepID=UPI00143EF565|nr:TonB-dependent receptor plug domain-containing protein [Geobacter sp. SVR]BCS55756.1 TonB-dependent receptor [Geobacter sp. SVR]GCF83760.1 TonB-dependent receptor [Geobacter sp. SVR]
MKYTILFSAQLLLVLSLMASPLFAMGTHEDQSEDIFSLGEVSVTAPSMTPIEAGETVHVISAEQIRNSSARTVDEALVLLSDVNVKLGADGVPRVEIRGFKARDILVLLDGVPINSAFDQQFDPSSIPVDSIEKIKVTTGASSVLYGTGGLGGVINIITKKGKPGLNGTVGFESGDGAPYLARTSLSGRDGKFDFFLSGSAYHRDNFPLARPVTTRTEYNSKTHTVESLENSGYRKNSDNTRNNVFLNLGYTPHSDLHFALTGNFVEGGYGKPASAINNTFDPYAPTPQYARVDNYQGFLLQLAADYAPSAVLDIPSRIYYNRIAQDNNRYDDENYNSFDHEDVAGSYRLRNTGEKRGVSLQPKYDFGAAGTVTVGLLGGWDTWTASGEKKPGGYVYQNTPGSGAGSPPYKLFPVADEHDVFLCSVTLEYEVPLGKNIGFAVGYGHHWQIREDKTLEEFSLSGSLYYDLYRDTRLKAAFMRNVRFPTMSELYMRPTNNPTLDPEIVYHYQLGVEQKLPGKSFFKINGFYSDLHNFIGLKQSGLTQAEGFVPYNVNFSLYSFYGFETSLETAFLKNVQMKLNYTLNVSKDSSLSSRDDVQYVPLHKLVLTGKYDFDFGLTPFVSVVYVAHSAVYTKPSGNTQLPEQVFWKTYMGDYAVANVKLSQKLFKDRATVYIGADNILDKDYEDTYGIPRPGRFVYGGFEYRFGL